MKYLNIKNKKNRNTVKKLEQNKFILKIISKNTNLFDLTRWKASLKLKKLKKTSSKTVVTNRCILSNRKNRLTRKINLSRLLFLNFARSAEINGIRKAAW